MTWSPPIAASRSRYLIRRQVVEDLAQAIIRLAQTPAERQRLSPRALERARQYLWSRQGERMAAVYESVLSSPRSQAHCMMTGPRQLTVPLNHGWSAKRIG